MNRSNGSVRFLTLRVPDIPQGDFGGLWFHFGGSRVFQPSDAGVSLRQRKSPPTRIGNADFGDHALSLVFDKMSRNSLTTADCGVKPGRFLEQPAQPE